MCGQCTEGFADEKQPKIFPDQGVLEAHLRNLNGGTIWD